ncbi:hypothetical protein [uncultured Bifidobacterium sp.]|uniref:hypothetical protein n=1 Tax=uncultured Bifidobacterium sp. TaxID=165187 RepID=UPI002590F47E|nr:hypothetical protein [uncultured Bifidobacterium sp.]
MAGTSAGTKTNSRSGNIAGKQPVDDIHSLNAVACLWEFIHAQHVFGPIVANAGESSKLALCRLLRFDEIGDLIVGDCISAPRNEIYLFVAYLADANVISASPELHVDDALQNLVNRIGIVEPDGMAQSLVNRVIYSGLKMFSACGVLPV